MADTLYKFVFGDGRAHLWQIKPAEKDNGRLTHRREATGLLGRQPHTQSGDLLGLILRKEPEGHLPEHVIVQPYFGSEVPPTLLTYLEHHFPGATARVGHFTHPQSKEASWQELRSLPDAAAWAQENLSVETGWLSRVKRLF